MREFARGSQSASCPLKSAALANDRPGMNEVSRNPFARSAMPLDSGSNAFSSTICMASAPANDRAAKVSFRPRPMAASLSQSSRPGTPPRPSSKDHIPASRSPVVRVGIIRAVMNRENDGTITSTGGVPTCPCPSGIFTGGNHRSH